MTNSKSSKSPKSKSSKSKSSKSDASGTKVARSKSESKSESKTESAASKKGQGVSAVAKSISKSSSTLSNGSIAVVGRRGAGGGNRMSRSGGQDNGGVAVTKILRADLDSSNLKVGDKIVYPGHGVGCVDDVVSKSIVGTEQKVFEITIVSSGMRIMVPVAQANSVGLRRVVDRKAVGKVYKILKDRDFKIDTQTWNRRFREYTQKIETGSVFEIAEVLRDLSVLSADKELSFGEKKMLDKAKTLLVSEIAIAKARSEEKVMGELKTIFT